MGITRTLWHFCVAAILTVASSASFAGFFISNGQLVDDNGTPFVMRGVAYPYTWFQSRPSQQDIVNIAATGANTIRFVLSTGGQWPRVSGTQLSQLIQWSKDNRIVAVLEVHDSTGWNESGGAVPISNAVAYWTSSDVRAAINGQEDFVIINIANEPFGNSTTANYVPDTIAAIQALRNAGLTHNLMVDAANWGQDWSNTMRNNAMQIWNADPQRNLTFSVHMYEVYAQASAVQSYMQAFDDMALPLVIGEFGADHQGQPVDEAAIMSQAQARGNGYIGWSWSGNGGCCVSLDIVSNFSTTLSAWGQTLVNGANGIRATSVPATVFGTVSNNLAVSTATLSFGSAAASTPVTVTANVSWSVTDSASWLSVSPTSGNNNGSFTVSATANTGTTSRSGTVTVSGGGLSRAISVTQSGTTTAGNFTVSAPASLALNRGGNVTASVSLARTSFLGQVSFSASGLPSGVTASFSPSQTTGNSSTLTLAASASATLGAVNITVTGTSGSTVRSTTVSLTVNQGGGGPGTATATALVTSSSGWFTEQQLRLSHTATITALSVTIVVQRTTGVSASGQYNTIGGQIAQSNSSTANAITYQFTLGAGQSLGAANNRTFAVQMGGTGTVHPSSGDTYTVNYTSGGQSFTLSGTF